MLEFLDLCGFDERESGEQLPRLQEVFARLGIGDADVREAKERLHTYYDTDLQGVRKTMRIILKDLADVVLVRDEGRQKVIHACMAPGFETLGTAINTYSREVGLIYPNFTFMVMLGCVFGKFLPVLDAAEKLWLRSGVVAHCGMVKTRLGLFALGMVPLPDMTLTTGFSCETSPKSNELIEEIYGIPALYVDACQDRQMSEYPDFKRTTIFAAKSMRRFSGRVRQITDFELTDDMVWRAIEARRPITAAMQRVTHVIRHSDPLPIGSAHLNLMSTLGAIPYPVEQIPDVVDALDTLHEELLERRRKGVGVTPKGAPRVLAICPMNYSDPRLEHLANRMGLALVASDFEFASEQRLSGAGIVNPDDPYDIIAQHLHQSPAQLLGGRIAIILDTCRKLDVAGVLNHYHVGCRVVAGDAMAIKDAVTRELGIPVLTFEWENFDPRAYDEEQFETKLEMFRGMMEATRDSR